MRVFLTLTATVGISSIALFQSNSALAEEEELSAEDKKILEDAGKAKQGLPEYTQEDLSKHKTKENRIWVSYKNGVYDITDFIEVHPGQEKILMAAGSSIEPFWAMYSQHYNPRVAEMLEELRIGNLKQTAAPVDLKDPYANDPVAERHPALVVQSQKPFNAETPLAFIAENSVTPNELFYVRNHLPVPTIDPKTYVLEITADGVPKTLKLSLQDLKTKFTKHSVEATIQCAGNRRNDMAKFKAVKGGSWEQGAISNAVWSGARLRDVLLYLGVDPDSVVLQHVQFEGLDKDFEKSYGASIPFDKAVSKSGDVLLAYEMNGKELPKDHGFPVRVVAPGITGARNVKWVHKVYASTKESQSHWQQNDYKGFSPNVDWNNVDWNSAPAIQDSPVQSAITEPRQGSTIPHGAKDVTVKGYAWSGAGRGIVRVDVSIDGGKNWHTANLTKPNQPYNKVWAWTLWTVRVPVPKDQKGDIKICAKAVDSSYNTQPETVLPIWNLRGVLCNVWHCINLVQEPQNSKRN